MTNPSLGRRHGDLTKDASYPIDATKLIESRLIVQANSGAGKSWAIRRIVEQTYGKAQQIVIDHDGEYHTLREKFDFVLARKGGEAPVDIKSAALLARRLLELNVSAIIDIYELGTQRAEFVKRFLDALVNAPRDLWHSAIIVLDEAHLYCPEKGSAVSSEAVKNLMALGRKRGFCGVLATQRIAKLDKDAAAECNSKLIGRSSLDVDMKRAADELGFTAREDVRSLRALKAGQFYAFGPAFTDEVELIEVGPVQTTHLRAGQRAAPPTPPRAKVQKILAQLADLPHEAAREASTIAELQAQVKQLKLETRNKIFDAAAPTKVEVKLVEKRVLSAADLKRVETYVEKMTKNGEALDNMRDRLAQAQQVVTSQLGNLVSELRLQNHDIAPSSKLVQPRTRSSADRAALARPYGGPPQKPFNLDAELHNAGKLPIGESAVMCAVIQFGSLQKKQLTVLTGYKRSTRDAYISRLRERGYLDAAGDKIWATDAGKAAVPNAQPLPVGADLREFWLNKLPSGEKAILRVLIDHHPGVVAKLTLDEVTGFKRSTRDAYLTRLVAKELVVNVGAGAAKASDALFEVG